MPQLTLTINGRAYRVACDAGQEQHVGRLARYLDQKVVEIVKGSGPAADSLLLLMAGLMVADELSDALSELKTLREERETAGRAEADPALARTLDELAERVDTVAGKLGTT